MFSLYAFCRVVDDIADDEKISKKETDKTKSMEKKNRQYF